MTDTTTVERQKAEERPQAIIVGPSAPRGQRDMLDPEQQQTYDDLASMRSALVTVGKRMGTITGKDPWQEVIDRAQKAATDKSGGEAREAPQTNPDDDNEVSGRAGIADDILIPPFDFVTLCTLFENSSALRQNIDAWITNVHGFGYRLEPVLDFGSPEINNTIRDLLLRVNIEKATENTRDLLTLTDEQIAEAMPDLPSVESTRARWEAVATIEKGRAECFFNFINPLVTLTRVRKSTGLSEELLGNAAWEILREDPTDANSTISQVYTVPFVNIRLLRSDREPTKVKMTIRKDAIHFDEVEVERYFRRYIRMSGTMTTYYKEFGDPRIVSRRTGHYFESLEFLKAAEGETARPANELYHWTVDSPISAYGVPRWISALLAVLGSRAAEEVNFLYFDNKAIPPMVLLVSGGRVSEQAVERLETYFNERVKGRANFHKIMIIEGVSQAVDETSGDIEHSGKLRLELKPLMQEIQQDALFQNYDQNNVKKIGRSFRQPQLLTGETADMNRSTAETAKAFAEEQIYQPARDEFDGVMNRHFMTNLMIHFWRFSTNAPVQRFPNDLIDNIKKSLDGGAITANEARKFVNDAFNSDLPYRKEGWADLPPKLAQTAARKGNMPSAEPTQSMAEDVDARAADCVGAAGGMVIASGTTVRSEEHQHRFVVLLEGSSLVVVIRPAEDHEHTATLDEIPPQGAEVSLDTSDYEGHRHSLTFTMPVSEHRKRARGFASFLEGVRSEIRAELEEQKDGFFSADFYDAD